MRDPEPPPPVHIVRITHVLPHRGGGAETYIDMLERLPRLAHRRFYLSSGRTPVSALGSVPARLPRLAARLRADDILHVHGDVASMVCLPLLGGRPAVITTHGLHMLRRARGLGLALTTRALRAAMCRSSAVICTSAAERAELAGLLRGADERKLRVIHNGIDPPEPRDEQDRLACRAELGVEPGAVLGLFAGQLEARKAPLLAAAAANRVRAAGVPFVLAIAGEGPQAEALRPLAGDGVRLLGFRSDLGRLLAAADVFVQPSEREGMSFALLEAMGHGLPVVAADGPGNPEAIGDAGMLFIAGDEAGLAHTLTVLSRDPEIRASLGHSARARMLAQFSAERFLAATSAAYMDLLGHVTAPGRPASEPPASAAEA